MNHIMLPSFRWVTYLLVYVYLVAYFSICTATRRYLRYSELGKLNLQKCAWYMKRILHLIPSQGTVPYRTVCTVSYPKYYTTQDETGRDGTRRDATRLHATPATETSAYLTTCTCVRVCAAASSP